jgi:hypothetical protein
MDATHNHGNADDMGEVTQTLSMALKQYASHSVKDLGQIVRDLKIQVQSIQKLQNENCGRLQQHALDIDKNLQNIDQNLQNIDQNRNGLQQHALDIDKNLQNIDKNLQNIDQNRNGLQQHALDIDKNRIGLKRNRNNIDSVRKKKRPKEIARIVSEAFQNSAHSIALSFGIVPQNTANPHTPQQTHMTLLRTSNTIERFTAIGHEHGQDHDEQAAHYDIDAIVHALDFEPLPLSHDPSPATSPSQLPSTSMQGTPSPYKKPHGKHPHCPRHNRRANWENSAHHHRKGLFKCPNGCRRNSLKIWSHS